MQNVIRISDRVDVVRCRDCLYFNDMSDTEKPSYCGLHTFCMEEKAGYDFYFYTNPNGYCAWADRDELKGQAIPGEIEF